MNPSRPLRIGTRGSLLAVTQSGWVRDRLAEAGAPGELVIIKTTGDHIQDRPLREVGGKGLFTKELEEALLRGDIDLAVHSLKDVPSELPKGLTLGAIPRREDPRDLLVTRDPSIRSIMDLPQGATVATGSLRRRAQLKHHRPDLNVVALRGNVDTRLRKLREGADGIEAIILAAAGVNRLGLQIPEAVPIPTELLLPAIGQGALALECSIDAHELETALLAIHDTPTATCVAAERELLERIGGDCSTPLAGHAVLVGSDVHLTGLICGPDGDPWIQETLVSPGAYARRTGGALAEHLLKAGGAAVLDALRGR